MDSLTEILKGFGKTFHDGIYILMPYVKNLVLTLAIIDTVLSHLKELEEGNHIHILVWNAIKYGFVYFLIDYYDFITEKIIEGFVMIGLTAGGSSISAYEFTDPSYIISLGHAISQPLTHVAKNLAALGPTAAQSNVANMEMMTQLSFVIIAIQVFITYLEFYVISALAIVFLPFGASPHTRFLADKVIPSIMGAGAKLMVMAFILSAAIPHFIASQMSANAAAKLGQDMNSGETLGLMASSMAVAFLCWQAPAMAASLMSATGTSTTADSGARTKQGIGQGLDSLGKMGSGLAQRFNGTGGAGASATAKAASSLTSRDQ